MSTQEPRKYRPPLTARQQRIVTEYWRLAMKYTRRLLFGYGLRAFADEVPSLAADALMEAVRVWEPSRATFPTCLRWWVRRTLQGFRAHGARVVHQSMDTLPKDFQTAFSLNQYTNAKADDAPDETWQDLLEDENADDPAERVDAARLYRAAAYELPRRVTGRVGAKCGKRAQKEARENFRLWSARVLEGAEYATLAKPLGVSRQTIQHRVDRMNAVFERWAAEIREEAA